MAVVHERSVPAPGAARPGYAQGHAVNSHPTHPTDWSDDPGLGSAVELAPRVVVAAGVLRFAFARSSGPGGQNVNKRSTKAELRVRLADLPIPPGVAERLAHQARGFMTAEGELLIVADEHRSQGQNRDECLARLRRLIVAAQHVPKVRRKTKPTRGSVERRIAEKKNRSRIKRDRREEG